jgi:nucleotide-binding universal stress UspA family protein
MKRIASIFLALITIAFLVLNVPAQDLSPKALQQRMLERRAVDAVIWGLPLVGEDAVKQAAFRDGKANYNDIVWWPKGGGWKNQSPTPNVNTRYMYFFISTKQDGPVVVELPPAVPGASFYGTIVALDGSPYSEAAWRFALAMAKQAKSQLISVAVAPKKGDISEAKAIIQKMFIAAKEAGIPLKGVKGVSPQGVAPDIGVVKEAIKNEVDLIVMGSYGRTGLKKLLMGSTTEKVIGNAPCPVLIVK